MSEHGKHIHALMGMIYIYMYIACVLYEANGTALKKINLLFEMYKHAFTILYSSIKYDY